MDYHDVKIEYEILSKIINNRLPTGASALALIVDASQSTIGRKLLELEYKGCLEKQSNKGRTITEEGMRYFEKLDNYLLQAQVVQLLHASFSNKKKLLDILQVRRILEKETVSLATKRVTKKEIKLLETIIDNQSHEITHGFLGDTEDLKFHRTIASFSGNEVLEHLLALTLTRKNAYSGFSYIRKKSTSSPVTDHRAILEAVKTGNAEEASRLIVAHIDGLIHNVNAYFEDREI